MNGDAQPQGTSDGRKFWMNDCEAVLGIVAVLLIIGSVYSVPALYWQKQISARLISFFESTG